MKAPKILVLAILALCCISVAGAVSREEAIAALLDIFAGIKRCSRDTFGGIAAGMRALENQHVMAKKQ
ncbi:hypothetical protein Y1Q_0010959 [Alligator mississippiensis]|uniref:Uncharacterized protein n=1 Tax=Alligator mississippiensis TaxID=8496 RepID=A0A151MEU9_ALLMI|nr:hypothetical protein Y1Q_0010959 [Alligator mississippiensis]